MAEEAKANSSAGGTSRDAHSRADAAFHAATAHLYDPLLERRFAAFPALLTAPWLDSLPSPSRGAKALDVGCGTGNNLIAFAERGYSAHGIDHSPEMVAIAERKLADRRLGARVTLRTGDVRALPYADGCFDVVLCTGVLHHLVDMRPCLAEIDRVLKPGGSFHLAEPSQGATPAIRLLERLVALRARLRGRSEPSRATATTSDLGIPEHEEGPISVASLTSILDSLGLERQVRHWSILPGVHHIRSMTLQRLAIRGLSAPWAHRSGNLVVVDGRKSSHATGLSAPR